MYEFDNRLTWEQTAEYLAFTEHDMWAFARRPTRVFPYPHITGFDMPEGVMFCDEDVEAFSCGIDDAIGYACDGFRPEFWLAFLEVRDKHRVFKGMVDYLERRLEQWQSELALEEAYSTTA